ncbi:MAG: hypothetical protein ABSA83_21895 [Verrucomicrobiota bacterium]|jgi:hypothetical protein
MKNITQANSIWPRAAALAATVISMTAAAFSAHAVISQDTLLITENSDTSLSVTWNGTAITPSFLADDHWQFNLPVGVYLGGERAFGSPNGSSIPEPGGSSITGPWNNVFDTSTASVPFVTLVDVQSDDPTTTGFATVIANDVSGLAGADANGLPVYLTFNDLGDSTGGGGSVPDHASTGLLALLSVIIVLGMARFRTAKVG